MKHVIIVGGGASGMMAAISAAQAGAQVDLYEKNEKTGKKVYITGKGRCNLTNDCPEEEFLQHVCSNPKFLFSSFQAFSNRDTEKWFEQAGLPIKTERGERVFPVSDHASDVIRTLNEQMRRAGVRVHLNTPVGGLITEAAGVAQEEYGGTADSAAPSGDRTGGRIRGVKLSDGTFAGADAVIVCTGGLSYASTGSSGDGYRFARAAGHKVTQLSPSLVPMEIQEEDARLMQGLSLKNVRMRILDGKKVLSDGFGEMLFTHFGVSGPLVLTASTQVQRNLRKHPLIMSINLKPAITPEQFDARLLREFAGHENKELKNVLGSVYPSSMIPVMIRRAGIPSGQVIHDITRAQRRALVDTTMNYTLTVTGLRGFDEAIITRGGVAVKEISPATMESKLVRGLYFAGEVLDLDAVTGGFNLQIAWTTGRAAGLAAGAE